MNWIRLKPTSRIRAIELTIRVLARPGTPTSRTWPRVKIAARISSMTSRWPMMTLFNSVTMTSRECRNSSRSCVIRSPAVDMRYADLSSGDGVDATRDDPACDPTGTRRAFGKADGPARMSAILVPAETHDSRRAMTAPWARPAQCMHCRRPIPSSRVDRSEESGSRGAAIGPRFRIAGFPGSLRGGATRRGILPACQVAPRGPESTESCSSAKSWCHLALRRNPRVNRAASALVGSRN